MLRLALAILTIGCASAPAQTPASPPTTPASPLTPAQALSRVSEEAALFQQNLPKSLTQEVLSQKTWLPPSRFQPNVGTVSVGIAVPDARIIFHQVVSEYSVGPLKNSDSHNLFEFRQVVSVDGKPVRTDESARRELTIGIKSQDDAVRKRMLQDVARFGLTDVATDYGLILLAFTARGQENMSIQPAGLDRIGSRPALVFVWKQSSSDSGELEFRGRVATRQALQGKLWVSAADGVPLRIEAWAEYDANKHHFRDEATVEYMASEHGFLTPASVVHHHLVDRHLITENSYKYTPFKLFAADSELKFTEDPEPPPATVIKK